MITSTVSITLLHHDENPDAILVWGAGTNEDGIQRWAVHVENKTGSPAIDYDNAFEKFQEKIIRLFENGNSNPNTPEPEAPPKETKPPLTVESDDDDADEETTDDPAEKEKLIQNARELFKLPQTEVITKELGIPKKRLYGEAQRQWGESDNWNIKTWNNYITAIANFHQRKGVLYDKLKPQYNKGNGQGQDQATGQGPF